MLENKVIIVTGGGSGMGRASALMFAAVGARVLIADWSEEGGQSAAEEIRKAGGDALFLKTDVSREDDVERMVKTAVGTFGRSEAHTSELQSLMHISYAVFCLKKKKQFNNIYSTNALCNIPLFTPALVGLRW